MTQCTCSPAALVTLTTKDENDNEREVAAHVLVYGSVLSGLRIQLCLFCGNLAVNADDLAHFKSLREDFERAVKRSQ